MVTVTAVGYDDISPEILIGRITSVFSMFFNIGFVEMINYPILI
ncbi:ion channel [Staphylococcus equorum]